jgi:biotin synthase
LLNKNEIIDLLQTDNPQALFQRANSVRHEHCGDEIHLRGIIEYSNYCRCCCAYCGLTAENKSLHRYRMPIDEVVKTASDAFNKGLRTIVLQAGEDPGFTVDMICDMVERIKSIGDTAITLSCGEYERHEYSRMKDAGADRYLLKIETTNPDIYRKLHPDCDQQNRIRCIHDLKELGFQTGSGALIGLPAQTIEDIADDILFCADFDLDMATFSPFSPHPDTHLASYKGGTSEMGHRVIAVLRLALPDTHIPVSTALASITPEDYRIAINAGANVIMADITPGDYVQYYDLYPGKAPTGEKIYRDNVERLKKIIDEIGRPLSGGRGDSLKM